MAQVNHLCPRRDPLPDVVNDLFFRMYWQLDMADGYTLRQLYRRETPRCSHRRHIRDHW